VADDLVDEKNHLKSTYPESAHFAQEKKEKLELVI
jgi:hypothetical protein